MITLTAPSSAPKVHSIFGTSKGTDKVERIVFKGFEDPKYHVAIARGVNAFTRDFYFAVKTASGETLWVNKSSFKKRFSHTAQEIKTLLHFLPGSKQIKSLSGAKRS